MLQLCRHKFTFKPVYAPDAPSSLPLLELVWGLAVKSIASLTVGARVRLPLTLLACRVKLGVNKDTKVKVFIGSGGCYDLAILRTPGHLLDVAHGLSDVYFTGDIFGQSSTCTFCSFCSFWSLQYWC